MNYIFQGIAAPVPSLDVLIGVLAFKIGMSVFALAVGVTAYRGLRAIEPGDDE